MWDTSGAKHKHILYNVSRTWKKSWNKLKNAIARHISLIKRQAQQWEIESKKGEKKWLYKTNMRASARLKKYGVTKEMIEKELRRKGLKDLIK